MVNLGSIPGLQLGQTKDYQLSNLYSQPPCLTFSIKRNSVKFSTCVIDWCPDDSLAGEIKSSFAVP